MLFNIVIICLWLLCWWYIYITLFVSIVFILCKNYFTLFLYLFLFSQVYVVYVLLVFDGKNLLTVNPKLSIILDLAVSWWILMIFCPSSSLPYIVSLGLIKARFICRCILSCWCCIVVFGQRKGFKETTCFYLK